MSPTARVPASGEWVSMLLLKVSKDGEFAEPTVTTHPNEALLQSQVLKRPALLPTQPVLAMCTEFPIPTVGRVDLVGVAEDGRIWVVECKLAANPEIRREIVGQVLAYAGGLWRMSYQDFTQWFALRAGQGLHSALQAAVGHEVDPDEWAALVEDSLHNGRFTLVLAVDKITDELKTIVEFLDLQTIPEVRVMALELAYYREGEVEILSPVTYGDQLSKPPDRNGAVNRWSRDGFVEALQAIPNEPVRVALTGLLAHGDANGAHPFWGSGGVPGMSYYYDVGGQEAPVWAMYLKPKGAVASVSFGSIAHVSPDRARAVLTALASNSGFAPYIKHVDPEALNKYPNIPAEELAKPGQLQAFLLAIELAYKKD
jgi:hypothetical protein